MTQTSKYKPQKHIDLLNGDYREWAEFLRSADQWDTEQIQAYQLARIKSAVEHAYVETSGYRQLYDAHGVHPDNINSIDDIHRFPFITKQQIRDRLDDFSVRIPGSRYVTTGGSTGVPFGFHRDAPAFARELASKAHQYYRIGWKEGDRQLVFRGLPITAADHVEYVPQFNELRCSSYHLVPEIMEHYRALAIEYEPQWIRCYPSSGYIFARFLSETARPFPRIKGALCASENLYDSQRQFMAEVFGCRIFSHYGHYELSALASYCEFEDTYHVLPQYGYVELIDPNGEPVTEPGASGEIVAKSFIMRATPFIRYRTGDIAVLEGWGCKSCGRPYQIWRRVEGRLQEFIITATGRRISMTAMNMHDDTFDCVLQFQFHQARRGYVTLRYIPGPACDAEAVRRMKLRLLQKLDDDVTLTMQPVDDIPRTERGKQRFLIQELSQHELEAG